MIWAAVFLLPLVTGDCIFDGRRYLPDEEIVSGIQFVRKCRENRAEIIACLLPGTHIRVAIGRVVLIGNFKYRCQPIDTGRARLILAPFAESFPCEIGEDIVEEAPQGVIFKKCLRQPEGEGIFEPIACATKSGRLISVGSAIEEDQGTIECKRINKEDALLVASEPKEKPQFSLKLKKDELGCLEGETIKGDGEEWSDGFFIKRCVVEKKVVSIACVTPSGHRLVVGKSKTEGKNTYECEETKTPNKLRLKIKTESPKFVSVGGDRKPIVEKPKPEELSAKDVGGKPPVKPSEPKVDAKPRPEPAPVELPPLTPKPLPREMPEKEKESPKPKPTEKPRPTLGSVIKPIKPPVATAKPVPPPPAELPEEETWEPEELPEEETWEPEELPEEETWEPEELPEEETWEPEEPELEEPMEPETEEPMEPEPEEPETVEPSEPETPIRSAGEKSCPSGKACVYKGKRICNGERIITWENDKGASFAGCRAGKVRNFCQVNVEGEGSFEMNVGKYSVLFEKLLVCASFAGAEEVEPAVTDYMPVNLDLLKKYLYDEVPLRDLRDVM